MVQAPETPCSQPTWVPVSRSSWRRQSAKVMRGSTSTSTCLPFTSNLTDMGTRERLGRSALERALDHGSGERAPIGGAGVDILLRIDCGARRLLRRGDGRLVDVASVEHRLGCRKPSRAVADADHAHMGVARLAALVGIVEYRRARHGEIAA